MIALLVGGPANGEVRQLPSCAMCYQMPVTPPTAYWVSDHAQYPASPPSFETVNYRKVPAAKGPNGEAVFLVQQ